MRCSEPAAGPNARDSEREYEAVIDFSLFRVEHDAAGRAFQEATIHGVLPVRRATHLIASLPVASAERPGFSLVRWVITKRIPENRIRQSGLGAGRSAISCFYEQLPCRGPAGD